MSLILKLLKGKHDNEILFLFFYLKILKKKTLIEKNIVSALVSQRLFVLEHYPFKVNILCRL